ncbi:penicillin-binding protein [Paenibacillus sp. TRM 82003]|uniref:penicillin-binding protein n=1 Tax=Kineococcus sp. TRM81007 TaxID=2925831 RepID=UPI001F593BD5|nr:penicillin-binding protein [Kineococcus sp. TRM81007]MCI2239542.1 penicillin-binding protein [Kineococcus sp. TRM81007]MCI3926176.1 penicillin-binding protein [Paenibacillus sp. TRM 82003]
MASGSTHRPVFRLLGAFTAVSAAGGVLAAGLVVPAVAATGSAARMGVEVFNELPSDLGDQKLSEATTIRWSDGSVMARVYDQNRSVVSFDQIAPVMRDAIVAIEDSRFYEHGAVDVKGIARALVSNAGGGDTQGASTLTQQYVKNVLVEQAVEEGDAEAAAAAVDADGVDGYARKLREMKLAVGVEKEMSKDEILAAYLNVAYFYNNVYGIEAAAQYYFSKPAAELALHEAALLAGLVQNPAGYNPVEKEEAAIGRRNVVLARMLELGKIDQAAHDAAAAAPLGLVLQPSRQGCMAAESAAYFCDYVTHVIAQDPAFGETVEEREELLRRGGLSITTTLDKRVQAITQEAVNAGVNPGQPARSAASVVEPGNGKILAMAQNTTYSPDEDVVGQTTLNYNVSDAMGGGNGFQQGSTFKPFTLATWLKSGRSLDSVVPSPRSGSDPISAFTACGSKIRSGDTYTYYNSESSSSGSMTVRRATSQSVNTAYVSMEKQLDICDIAATAQSLGVYKASATKNFLTGEVSRDLDQNPSMTLGTNLVTPLSIAGAYAAFAAEGTFCEPVAIMEVLDTEGNPLPVPSADCQQVLDPNVARNVTEALEEGWQSGTARRVERIGRPVASKTGTTNDSADVWFAAYTPQMAAAVWVGHASGTDSLNGESINGRRYRRVYGSTIPGPIWANIVGPAAEALGQPVKDFTPGTNEGLRTTVSNGRVKVPNVVGRSVSSATRTLENAGFDVSVSSRRVTSSIGAGLVARQSASSARPGATITLTRSAGRPAPEPEPEETTEAPEPETTSEAPESSESTTPAAAEVELPEGVAEELEQGLEDLRGMLPTPRADRG